MILGFTSFDATTPTAPQTTAEIIAGLTPQQRGDVLNGFAERTPPHILKAEVFLSTGVISYLYSRIIDVRDFSKRLCREEIIDTPAVYDQDTGELVTAATYVSAPTTLAGLKTAVYNEYSSEFTQTQSDAIVDKMMEMSKQDGDGDWAYYIVEIVK